MLDTVEPPVTVIFEGMEFGAELMGAAQANFFVPSLDREVAILVNHPAIQHALTELGLPDTSENRDLVASQLGYLLVLRKIAGDRLELVDFVGVSVFNEEEGILDDLRTRLSAAPA